MSNYSAGDHDKEHERLIRLLRIAPYATSSLPAATTANTGQRISYGGTDYYSDGTRWLSVQEYPLELQPASAFVNNLAASTTTALWKNFPKAAAVIYLTTLEVAHRTITTMSSTQNWTFTLNRGGGGGTFASILSGQPAWQTGRTAGTVYNDSYAVNAAFSVTTSGTGITNNTARFSLDATKVSTAGNLEITGATLWYRLMAT